MADVGRPADLAARDRLIGAITDRLGDVVPIKIIIAIVELEQAVREEERASMERMFARALASGELQR